MVLQRKLTETEIFAAYMRVAARRTDVYKQVLDAAGKLAQPGVSTDEIDALVHAETLKRGAYPSPLNYHRFPKSCCTSVRPQSSDAARSYVASSNGCYCASCLVLADQRDHLPRYSGLDRAERWRHCQYRHHRLLQRLPRRLLGDFPRRKGR